MDFPYGGGQFELDELVEHVRGIGGTIVIGQQAVKKDAHSKPHSLDFWLRDHPNCGAPDTKQMNEVFLDALVASGRFEIVQADDPENGRRVKSLRLIQGE